MPESVSGSLNAFTAGDVVIECVCVFLLVKECLCIYSGM